MKCLLIEDVCYPCTPRDQNLHNTVNEIRLFDQVVFKPNLKGVNINFLGNHIANLHYYFFTPNFILIKLSTTTWMSIENPDRYYHNSRITRTHTKAVEKEQSTSTTIILKIPFSNSLNELSCGKTVQLQFKTRRRQLCQNKYNLRL